MGKVGRGTNNTKQDWLFDAASERLVQRVEFMDRLLKSYRRLFEMASARAVSSDHEPDDDKRAHAIQGYSK